MVRLVVIGGGKMGEALVGGLVAAGWAEAGDIVVVEPVEARRTELAAAHEGLAVVADLDAAVAAATSGDGSPGGAGSIGDVLVAVKPNHVAEVCDTLGAHAPRRVLSIAAGVTTAAMEAHLPDGTRVIRAMPNTPALVGCGMSAVCGGRRAEPDDLDWASEVLASVGEVVVLDEDAIDAVTGVSGSGPAYVFLLAEALTAAGVDVGLDAVTADALTRQTLLGAARLLAESGKDPAQLRADVTSPNGTTAAGIAVFESRDLRGIVADVVTAATERSRELGRS